MTDEDVLDDLLSFALDLIEKGDKRGDRLWQIRDYLNWRLGPPWLDYGKVHRDIGLPEQARTPDSGREALVGVSTGTVNVFIGCSVDDSAVPQGKREAKEAPETETVQPDGQGLDG